jgi:hypothetical protein
MMARTHTRIGLGILGAALVAVPAAAQEETYEEGRTEAAPVAQARRPASPRDYASDEPVAPYVYRPRAEKKHGVVGDEPRFFAGLRTGIGAPPAGRGVTPTGGLELGVAAKEGLGLGIHLIGMANPPEVRPLNIPKAEYGFGAAADLRFYIQTVEPLTLYPTLSIGFLAGPSATGGENAVMPMVNPGFGARVKLGPVYTAFEFGLAGFFIPFVNMSVGWEGEPKE